MSKEQPFRLDELEDVSILLKVKGKHYAIVPSKDINTLMKIPL